MRYHITLSIKPELLQELDRLSKDRNKPRNRIIEELITEAIKTTKKRGGKK